MRTDKLDEAVWNDVRELLRNPDLLRQEYERRLQSSSAPSSSQKSLSKQVEQSRKTVNRLIDAYSDGVIRRDEFDVRITRARQQLTDREQRLNQSHADNAERETLQERFRSADLLRKTLSNRWLVLHNAAMKLTRRAMAEKRTLKTCLRRGRER